MNIVSYGLLSALVIAGSIIGAQSLSGALQAGGESTATAVQDQVNAAIAALPVTP